MPDSTDYRRRASANRIQMAVSAYYRRAVRVVASLCFVSVLSLLLSVTDVKANLLEQPLTAVDRDLPSFSLLDFDGNPVTPETLKGKTWLINFWAVWCAPCLEELPDLNDAWAQLKDKDVGMLAINIGEEPAKIAAFLQKHNLRIDFPIVIGDKIKTLGNWSGRGLPFTVVVSPQGKVVYEATGPRDWGKPEFIDTVLAVQSATPVGMAARVASTLGFYHQQPIWLKVLVVIALVLLAVLLFFLVRRLHRKKFPYRPAN